MQIFDRIDAIEKRAQAINLTLAELCKSKGVYLSTVTRWRAGADPKQLHADRLCSGLEAELDRREQLIFGHLIALKSAGRGRLAT